MASSQNTVQQNTFGQITVANQSKLKIIQHIHTDAERVRERPFVSYSPYRGLKHFDEESRHQFFGREKIVAELNGAIKEKNLLVVAGSSGSGKSSVVRAGLIPVLRKQLNPAVFRSFRIERPDRNPFFALAQCLDGFSQQRIYRACIEQPSKDSLRTLLTELPENGAQWLLFIDRFEEIFQITEERYRRPFLDGLVDVLSSPPQHMGFKLVLAMRSDYLDNIAMHAALADMAPTHLHLVKSMDEKELRDVIEQPAAHHGAVFEKDLVTEILADVSRQAGALPLLQYTLNQLWEMEFPESRSANLSSPGEQRTIHRATYLAQGGVRGFLAGHADKVMAGLTDSERKAVRHIFLRAIEVVESPASRKIMAKRVARTDPDIIVHGDLINRLVSEGLIVARQEGKTGLTSGKITDLLFGRPTIELAHEVLIDAWPKLREWLTEARQAVFMHGRIAARTQSWLNAQKDNPLHARDELMLGSELRLATSMLERGDFDRDLGGLNPDQRKFLHESRTRQARRWWRRRLEAGSAITLIALIIAGAVMVLDFFLHFGLLRALCRPI